MSPLHFRTAIADLVPYEPGKPAEELARERGLGRVIKLASNEGPWGPLPLAAKAIEDGVEGLNRYPDGACVILRECLASHHEVELNQVIVGHGADSIINNLSMAMLEPGDNIVCGWPSFPSYVLDARKMGAIAKMIPLDDEYRYDLDAMLAAVDARTRIVYVCNPNNPTGTMVAREQLTRFLDALPDHVLPVLDEAYYEYVQHADYPDGIVEYFNRGRQLVVLRTFSKIYGLAGLRVGYAVAPAEVATAVGKVRNAFDVTALAQAAAVASIGERHHLQHRALANAEGLSALGAACERAGLKPVRSVANFLCVPVGRDGREVYELLLDEGIIVRPLAPFGMPNAVRITVGTPEENDLAVAALERTLAAV
jgi:histidinol-phosphate aminotransferase